MTNHGHRVSSEHDTLKNWRQGDFAIGVGGFLFAGLANNDEAFEANEHSEGIVGLAVISQSCDIVRRSGGRHYIAVCPLIEVGVSEIAAIRSGRRPYLTDIENAGESIFADLRRIMSVDKGLASTWKRQQGFSSEAGRLRFAAALERKFGQFAFPDEFALAIKPFRDRVWSRHTKTTSEPGMVYRSLAQIRFRADPSWSGKERKITVFAIMLEEDDREVEKSQIKHELDQAIMKIQWPDGYVWAAPPYVLATARDLTAEDVITSQRGDFDFLCY